MKKTTDYQKEFLEVFKKLSYCRSSWDVWKDFLDMGCISMSNSVPALYREDREKGYLSVSDPACGAGAMLIAFANVSREQGINFQQKVLFVAQDIDVTATRMCYLQLADLGCPAIVICGDSLAKPGFHPDNNVWYTPFYYLNEWRFVEKVPGTKGSEEIADIISETKFQENEDGQLCIQLDKTA